ncbi:MAG: 16S rRNA (cytosine(1402)-N(4))-methyltransferase RsmH [Deltaproteobacteria bacterium]|nr:16S rRNA (cytosine(1402)-N(4))-methyltransferase RsmH [Deltaproteobacteria bacterium]
MDEHVPVLLDDVLALLAVRPGGLYVDGTLGLGGHSSAILAAGGRLLATDRDAYAIARARERLGAERPGADAELHHAPFSRLPAILGGRLADGILLDLGVSSPQLDRPERGFSFRADGPVDFRMDPSAGEPASAWLDRVSEAELVRVLFEFGEERHARRVARALLAARPLRGTLHLAEVVAGVVPRDGRIHPATRTFQALRIVTNDELGELDRALQSLPGCLAPGGRLVVISFHSLEDRRVKDRFRDLAGANAPRDLYGHPLVAPAYRLVERRARKGESDPNPRARSARLRALERLP